ncbi:MAG TPA: cytochrome-c oxidase, cbb3-type subunit III, partial [Psychrobacter sp.]|nr:cytochrome-c oxidase, cbb3-type subunit III [Psychrobacter sp.]
RYGRAGVMPQWETKLGNERIMLLAAYVYSLSDKTGKAPETAMANTAATQPVATKEATAN